MKNIDSMAATAFRMKHRFTRKNTKVVVFNGEVKMYLFGNLIAKTENSATWVTDAGWPTKTTKNRLNGLGADIRLSKGQLIFREKLIMNNTWIKL
jgi:hypothetical protein